MNRVRIVTDSTSDIPLDLIEKYEIIVVPLKVSFGDEVYREGVDITSRDVISKLETSEILPKTSQPSPGEFVAVYEKIIAAGDTVVSIHLSGKLSGTVQSAKTAKTLADSDNIIVIDSRTISMSLGYIVLAAAEAAQRGFSAAEIVNLVYAKMEKTFIYFVVGTLEYLEKGGRIGKAAALMGSFLKIAPILTFDHEGQIVPAEKVRGKNKAAERMADLIAERIGSAPCQCAYMFGNDPSWAHKMEELVSSRVKLINPGIINRLGSVILCHGGPDIFGVIVYPE